MAITVELPPEMAKEAQEYVMSRGTTIEQLLFDRLKAELARRREGQDVYEYLMSQGGWLPKDFSFDRAEANSR